MKLLSSSTKGAKIILTGEHAVVYGIPSIAIPFNGVSTTVNIYKTNQELSVNSKFHVGLLKDGTNTILGMQQLIYYLFDYFGIEKFGFHFEVISTIESQKGMGSSAALAIAATEAIFKAFKKPLEEEKLIEYAMYAEKIHHTNPSGLDVYTIVYQKPIEFIRNKGFNVLDINLKTNLIIIDTLVSSQTKLAVEAVSKLKDNNPMMVEEVFNQISKISLEAKISLKNNDTNRLIELINENQQQLQKIGVSSDVIEQTISKAKTLGLEGLKLTGGGVGGCVISLSNDQVVIEKIKSNFKNVWVYNLGELS